MSKTFIFDFRKKHLTSVSSSSGNTYEDLDEPLVECVHCGFTNKFRAEERFWSYYGGFANGDPFKQRKSASENTWFYEEFKSLFRVGKYGDHFNEKGLKLISKETEIMTNHAGILYKLAKGLSPDGTNEELVKIMLDLHNLENWQEKNRLVEEIHMIDLLKRYKKEVTTGINKYIRKIGKKK